MSGTSCDALVIGGGHNGLTAAAYLAKAGLRTLVLEARPVLGGAAATEEVFPGYRVDTGAHDAGMFRPEVVRELELEDHGLEFLQGPALAFSLLPGGDSLTLWRDPERTEAEIGALSTSDAASYPRFRRLIGALAPALEKLLQLTPPPLADGSPGDLIPWARAALQLRMMPRRDLVQLMRILPMSAQGFLDEWFEGEALKGLLASGGLGGCALGPRASGTAFLMLYHMLGDFDANGYRSFRYVRGGAGQLSLALASAARAWGAEIRTGTPVERVLVEAERATGAVLPGGEEIRARVVVSSADPGQTLLKLVGAHRLPLRESRRSRCIRFQGCCAKLLLALDGAPRFKARPEGAAHLSGRIILAPSMDYLERASDHAKYGEVSSSPFLEAVIPTLHDPSLAPPGKHLLSATIQYAPLQLRGSSWSDCRRTLAGRAVSLLSLHAHGLESQIEASKLIAPPDWQNEYRLSQGCMHHGQMQLDQLLFMRPIPGWGRYRMPVDGLYLCGSGAHPGGGVTGLPGRSAAREILHSKGPFF